MDKTISICSAAISIFLFFNFIIRRLTIIRDIDAECDRRPIQSPVYRMLAPLCSLMGSYLEAVLDLEHYDSMRKNLAAADIDDVVDVPKFMAFKILLVAFGGVAGAFLLRPSLIIGMIAGSTFGYLSAGLWLKGQINKRRMEIELELPFIMDMLTLSVEAGMDFIQSIARINKVIKPGPMKREFSRMLGAIGMGVRRADAMKAMADRARVPALTSIVSLFVQADKLGTGISSVLKVSSARLRSERFAKAEEKGAKAAQKILLPLILCIMPATFIVVFGPLIVRLMTGGFENLLFY